jgi:hypothetical protein
MTTYDDVPTFKYSEVRRNDVELREQVKKVVAAREKAVLEASELLKQAAKLLSANTGFVGDETYARNAQTIRIANATLARDAKFMMQGGSRTENPTYIGNLAAGPLGEQIQGLGDSFPL